MSTGAQIDADTLLEGYDETRKYLEVVEERDVPDGATVPRDELVETVTEWGYDRRTVRDTLGLAVERGDYERADGGVRPVRDEPVEDAEPEENPAKEAGSSEDTASNPRRSATENAALEDADDTVDEARVLDAFETCVRFYHEHADDELPEECDVDAGTPREYFEEVRGWDADTVEEKRLGYAPAGHGHELLDRLMSEGYTREEILGTGLFYDLGTPHFEGRVVFPYFDGDGRPCYAISRTTGHPEDPKANQKYTKAVKTKDYSHVDEPIYGLETLDDETETVLVAEGMPDAITAHELGHAAVSPVTTQFKRKHHDVVLEAVADTGTRVVVVADNDSVDPDLDEEERLEVTQYGEGLKGALRTADFLVKNGVDARVTVPPVVAHPGNDLDRHVLAGQVLRLLAAPPEDGGVAALQPDDVLAPVGAVAHQFVDLTLGRAVGRALAHVDGLDGGREFVEDRLVRQRIVEDDVRVPESVPRPPGEQFGVTGTGTDERNPSTRLVGLLRRRRRLVVVGLPGRRPLVVGRRRRTVPECGRRAASRVAHG